jgi:CO/xanthine dehydrogenase Mo-binding subunit/CO/xanthine dehydrogenase FAD-binding subunit
MTATEHVLRVVGRRVRPPDWEARTTGRASYGGDLRLPGLLEACVVRSPWPHAAIDAIDTSAARWMPGVHAVVTAADLAQGVRYAHSGGADSDRPPLADGVVRYLGQEVAAVAAETPAQAKAAAAAVEVRYRPLDAPLDVAASRSPGAPRLHERPTGEDNVAFRSTGSWGDPDSAWAAVVHRTEGRFSWARQAQAPMEPQTVVARWDARTEVLELWPSTQAPYFVAKEVAAALGLDGAQVRCHEVAVGGGFGAKSKVCEHEVLAARLSQLSGRPVRLQYTREEEFTVTKTRHPFRVDLRSGLDAHGRIVAIEATIEVENGAYNHYGPQVTRVGVKTLGSVYTPIGVRWDAALIDTAVQPTGPFRGYGAAQVAWAVEQHVDELAALAGRDPLELRRANANQPGTTMVNGSKLGSARLVECLDAVRDAIGWDAKRAARTPWRGVGVAIGSHGSGSFAFVDSNRSEAAVSVDADGRVVVRFGGADAGTGQRTILGQIAAEILGVDPSDVDVRTSDPDVYDQGAWSSRGTHMGGHAARVAAEAMAGRLRGLAAAKLGTDDIALRGGAACSPLGDVDLGDLVALDPDGDGQSIDVLGEYVDPRMERYDPANPTPNVAASYTFAAHAVEVEVDPLTGRIAVLDYVAAHDIGRALNPSQCESQIVGGVAMGIGAALSEELRHRDGRAINASYVHYAMPRTGDLPRIRTVLVEGVEEAGPFDAKSVGEMSIIPVAPAIANAVYDAIGIRFRDTPITPDKVLAALAARDGRTRSLRWRRSPHRWWVEAMRRAYPRGLHRVLHTHGTRLARKVEVPEIEAVEKPRSVPEALAALEAPRRRTVPVEMPTRRVRTAAAVPVGGATDLLVQRRQGLVGPRRLVATSAIPELRRLDLAPAAGSQCWIGGALTLAELADAARGLVPVLAEAIDTIASVQIRTTATVAGNLLQAKRCWFFRNGFDCYKRGGITCPCYAVEGDHRFGHAVIGAHRCQAVTPSDLATVLVALDASVVIEGRAGRRVVAMGDLYTGPGESVVADGELLVALRLPADVASRQGAFEKLALWDGDFASASVAVTVRRGTDGARRDARIVLGAVAPTPWRARVAEAALDLARAPEEVRVALDRELDAHAHPLPGNGWKLDAVSGLALRALNRLGER